MEPSGKLYFTIFSMMIFILLCYVLRHFFFFDFPKSKCNAKCNATFKKDKPNVN